MPRGGRRNPPGGRPKGSRNALPLGTVAAIKSINAAKVAACRAGSAASDPEALAAIERCIERMTDVLEERVNFQAAGPVLKAAGMITEAIAGPQKQAMEHSGEVGVTVEIRKLAPEPVALPETATATAPAIIIRKAGA